MCAQLRADGHEDRVAALTGLRLDPYFSATKLAWIAANEPHVWAGVDERALAVGTVDSYLMARMSRGLVHATDASNASRTLLYDLGTGDWSDELCELFSVPRSALPEIVASYGTVGRTDPSAFLGLDLPIAGIAGDQQAALFGQGCFAVGSSKCTYGTGSFILVNTGPQAVPSSHGLLTTVAWQHPDGSRDFALEGSVFVTGSAVQWLRDGLGIIERASDSEALARSVPDSGGVVFVPALTGMGAPDWDPTARGAILGLTRATTRAHLARATLDAIAFQVRDVVDLMVREAGAVAADARGGRRRGCQRPALPAAGRPARGAGAAARGAGDDRDGRGVPGRPGHRGVVLHRRDRRDLAARSALRARDARRGRAPPLALGGRPGEGLGPRGLTARGGGLRRRWPGRRPGLRRARPRRAPRPPPPWPSPRP